MLRPNEVAVGNYVMILSDGPVRMPTGVYLRITEILFDAVTEILPTRKDNKRVPFALIDPIGLSPEILANTAGFEKHADGTWYFYVGYKLCLYSNSKANKICLYVDGSASNVVIQYLNDLQNLVFQLSGKHLDFISPPQVA